VAASPNFRISRGVRRGTVGGRVWGTVGRGGGDCRSCVANALITGRVAAQGARKLRRRSRQGFCSRAGRHASASRRPRPAAGRAVPNFPGLQRPPPPSLPFPIRVPLPYPSLPPSRFSGALNPFERPGVGRAAVDLRRHAPGQRRSHAPRLCRGSARGSSHSPQRQGVPRSAKSAASRASPRSEGEGGAALQKESSNTPSGVWSPAARKRFQIPPA